MGLNPPQRAGTPPNQMTHDIAKRYEQEYAKNIAVSIDNGDARFVMRSGMLEVHLGFQTMCHEIAGV